MALKDLIQQAKQSRLGKAISNLDRDKEREGFQFISPQTRRSVRNVLSDSAQGYINAGNSISNSYKKNIQPGLSRVSTSFRENPQQYNIFSPQSIRRGASAGQSLADNLKKATNIPEQKGQLDDIIRGLGNFSGNFLKTVSGGMADIGSERNRLDIKTPLRVTRGFGKVLAPFAPGSGLLYQGSNVLSSFDKPLDENDRIRRLTGGFLQGMSQNNEVAGNVPSRNVNFNVPVVGDVEFDPLKTVGSMAGFVKNPQNQALFKFTESLIPTKGSGAARWLLQNGARGGIEDIILNLPDQPDNLSEREKVQWLVSTFGQGVVSELVGQGFFQGGGKIVGGVLDSKATKEISKVFDQITDALRRANIPVKLSDLDPRTGEQIEVPMWKADLIQKGILSKPGFLEVKTPNGQTRYVPDSQAGFIDFGADLKTKSNQVYNEIFESKTPAEAEFNINNILEDIRFRGDKTDFQALKRALKDYKAQIVTGPGLPRNQEYDRLFNLIEEIEATKINDFKTFQSEPQASIEESIPTPKQLENSKATAQKIKNQKQKGLTFREQKPVQGGSRLQVKPGELKVEGPSKVSSDISISRDKKYSFNINKKKLGLNKEQSRQLDNVVETMRPVLEGNKGETLTKQEIVEGGRKANVLQDVVGREESKAFSESLQASRNLLKSEQSQVGITPKFLEQLEIVSSVAADAGRRLQAFNIGAEDITIKEKVLRDILKIGADVDEVLKAGKNVDWNDAKQITDFYRKFKPATLADKLDEYRYTNMLSSPNTHINNTFSNFLQTAVIAPIEKTIRGTVSFAESRLTGKEQEYFARQGVDYSKGYWKALPEAIEKFKNTLSGVEGLTKPDIDFIPTSTSRLRQIYTFPLQALEASDQFFRTLVKGGEIESLKAEGVTGAKATKIAEQEADYRTFRQAFDPEGKLGQNKVLQIWDKWNSAIQNLRNVQGGKYLVPFLQTPTNILKQGVEYSPLGFSTVVGSARPTEQLAKAIIGTTVFSGAYALAESGLTTWDTPTNSTERAEFYAAGLQPYSVKIGDKWVSYSKLGPLAYPIAMASALKWAKDEGADEDQLATIGKTLAGTLGFFADQSYVRGIGDIIDAFRGDEYKQARGLSNIPAQMIPYRSFMGWVARQVDPIYRKSTGGPVLDQVKKSLVSQIPFASKSLEAYETPFGTESERQFPTVNAFSPFSISQERPEEFEYYNARNRVRTQNKEVNRLLEKIEEGESVPTDTDKLLTDQAIKLTKKKIEAGIDVTPQELETAYLNNVIQMPSSNRYEKGQRDSKLWTKTGEILDNEDLSEAQKQTLIGKVARELGVTEQDVQIYQVAKQNNDAKTLYVLDEIDRMQDPQQLLSMLSSGRKPVNGKILISDGVIDNLVDDGIIPEQLGKDLKNLDFNADGTLKQKKSKKGGGGRSKKSAEDKAFERYLANLAKITLPSGKIRTQAPMRINVKGLTFSD